MKPIIGITPSSQVDTLSHGTFQRYCVAAAYVRAVEGAGGIPVIIPPQQEAADQLIATIDGLVLSGGPDVEPSRYGDSSVHPATYGIDPERDQFEIDLFNAAQRLHVPVLGICRGIQLINVALGGTLIQDVADEHLGAAEIGHRQHERGLDNSAVGHSVETIDTSLVPFLDGNPLEVNSFHHQAVRDLAPGLLPAACSEDGIIEAVVKAGEPTVFAVQWHPELMAESDRAHFGPFTHLIASAAAKRLAGAVG